MRRWQNVNITRNTSNGAFHRSVRFSTPVQGLNARPETSSLCSPLLFKQHTELTGRDNDGIQVTTALFLLQPTQISRRRTNFTVNLKRHGYNASDHAVQLHDNEGHA
jgi:hypothetical protein